MTSVLAQTAEPTDAAPQAGKDVRRLLGEDQRPRARARETQRHDHDPGPTGLAVADRHLALGLPEVELQQLAAAIDGALEGPRPRRVERAQLSDVVIDQRLAAVEAQLADQLEHADRGQLGVLAQQPLDLLFGSSFDAPTRRR